VEFAQTGLRLCPSLREQISDVHLAQWLSDDNPDEDPIEEGEDAPEFHMDFLGEPSEAKDGNSGTG
jgi:hypothetical protein